MSFDIEHVALHLVDKEHKELTFSSQEILLNQFGKIDREKILNFFGNHLESACNSREKKTLCSAMFNERSIIYDNYEAFLKDSSQFFDCSKTITQHLYDVSHPRASRGVLIIILFKIDNLNNEFLGLFKMDPANEEKISLPKDDVGNILLNLAVNYLDQALPDPGDKVLKWAIIPHPSRPHIDVLVKDEQGTDDVAAYFMDFLGCTSEPREDHQIEALYEATESYVKDHLKGKDPFSTTYAIASKISEIDKEIISINDVTDAITESKIIPDFDKNAFEAELDKQNQSKTFYVTPGKIRNARVVYKLANGIIIRGSISAVESSLKIEEKNNTAIITITTSSYEKSYDA